MDTLATREAELFGILVDLLADKESERDALRVRVGARGFELGRPYLQLCRQGLVDERLVSPNFFGRLFGAREAVWVQLTEYGRQVAQELAFGTQSIAAPLKQSCHRYPHPEPSLTEANVTEGAVEVANDVRHDLQRKPTGSSPRRQLKILDYTEALGGTPLENAFSVPASDRLEGLSELTGLLGFELTDAGRFLAMNRWASGETDSQVALEIITTALAHAVRLSDTGTTALNRDAVEELIDKVKDTFQLFVSEGILGADRLAGSLDEIRSFLVDADLTSGFDEYLSDPLRGIAPPAICPEETYLLVNIAED